MNYSTSIFLINKSVRAVKVSYEPEPGRPDEPKTGALYIFKTFDPTIVPKDLVIIPTDTRWFMTIGRVEEVDVDVDFDSTIQLKWIVGKVDRPSYDTILAKEGEAIAAIRSAEVRRKREELAKNLFADNEELAKLSIVTSAPTLPSPPSS